jgi:hypothetical protein
MPKDILPEHEERPTRALFAPADFEDQAMDLAIEALSDIEECDEASVLVKWDEVMGKTCPILYVFFADRVCDESVPRVHIDRGGELRPAHAVCLASLPSGILLSDARIRDTVRKGVEDFLRKYNVRKKGPTLTLGGRIGKPTSLRLVPPQGRYVVSVVTKGS